MHDQDLFLERALLDRQLAVPSQIQQARTIAREKNVDLTDALISQQVLTERQLALVKANICEVPFVDLDQFEVRLANSQLVPRHIAQRYAIFPLLMIDNVLTLAMDDPMNLEAADAVRQVAKCEVDSVLCERAALRNLISRAYSLAHSSQTAHIEDVGEEDGSEADGGDRPIVAAVNQLLTDAATENASDIHINPDENALHVRYRIDGVLQSKQGPPLSMHAGLVQRLKVMANLDLTQTRRPQDGKFRFRHDGRLVDVRFSTIPTVCGENVVLRLLANTQNILDFHELGIPPAIAASLSEMLEQPYGMVLVTGPTGSGKTTTLYSALSKVNDPSRNIVTIEDPVEIRMPYVRQVQVNQEIGMTFASALRSILRQDPDVVLLGEIRDNETATIALQAALTGHLVLSTVHTNDAVGAVARLRDYGLPSFVINSAVLGVIAQRLVRRVCQHCRGPAQLSPRLRDRFKLSSDDGFVSGKGCNRCSKTGYRGRVGIYELFKFTTAIQASIEQGGSVDRIRQVAVSEGMRLMWQDGLEKARAGQTTLEEISKAAAVVDVEPQTPELRFVA